MLILTRHPKQKIIINNNIEIVVLKTKGKQVKLGIIAPREILVYREEIFPHSIETGLPNALLCLQSSQND